MVSRRKIEERSLPILEHPGDEPGVIEPARIYARKERIPRRCVLCFFHEVIEERAAAGQLELIASLPGEGVPTPVYRLDEGGEPLAVVFPGIGASFAASVLEELIALGGRGFVCAGGAGVLDGSIPVGRVLIPTAALRDEGTSYHYQRQGRFSEPHPAALAALEQTCRDRGVELVKGKTWTTDAPYRETPTMVRHRRAEGCIAVEMESAAFFAVASFRQVVLGQLLYAGDDVSGERWKHRHWQDQGSARRDLLELAIEACLAIPLPD